MTLIEVISVYRWKVEKEDRSSADLWLEKMTLPHFNDPIKQSVSDDGWYLFHTGKQSVV